MGVVYRARQLDLDRTVALKLIAPSLAQDPAFRERFIREARVAASLDHPNVIPVFSAGEEDGVLYLAMRFVVGDDLRTLVRREGALEGPRAAQITRQLGAALDAAHARGIVHRDVKPANVLLGEGDHVYLTDFGLTKRADSAGGQTRAGGWVGTLGYVAPEQIRGERVDARTDVYALGCVLFHALSGVPPYGHDSDEATMWAHLHDPTPPLPQDASPLNAVIARALAKDPADRFRSAGDLGRAALAAADGREDLAGAAGRAVATGAAASQARDDRPTAVPSASSVPGPAFGAATPAAPAGREPADRATPATEHAQPRADATTATPPRGPRSPLPALLAGAVVLAAAGIGAALLLAGGDDPTAPRTSTAAGTTTAGPPPVAQVDSSTSAGSRPNDVVAGPRGTVWVVSNPDARMSALDAATGLRGTNRQPSIGIGAQSVAAGLDRIWVIKNGTNSLIQLSDRSGRRSGATTALPAGEPVRVRTGEGAVWIGIRGPGPVSPSMVETVVKVDPRTGATQSIRVPGGVQDLDVGAGAVWVVGRGTETVTRISARTGVSRTFTVGRAPRGVAVGGGSVWVANSAEGSVTRISTTDGADRDRIEVGTAPRGVAHGAGGVWVTNELDDTVTRIDPATAEVVGAPITGVGRRPTAISARGDAVWVVSPQDGAVARIAVP